MRIIVVAMDDGFVIPKNINKIFKLDFVDITEIIVVKSKNSLVERKKLFIKGFGVIQVFKMGLLFTINKFFNKLDLLFGGLILKKKLSCEAFCKRNKINYCETRNINSERILKNISKCNPDLIVSFSAPTIFKKNLLEIPKLGCINLHCSLLPKYAGVLPSFWTLYNDEKYTGATVHFMDTKIDNGEIINQKKIRIKDDDSMFSLIKSTKSLGGEIMIETLRSFENKSIKTFPNCVLEDNYYSWPDLEHFRALAKKRKLI